MVVVFTKIVLNEDTLRTKLVKRSSVGVGLLHPGEKEVEKQWKISTEAVASRSAFEVQIQWRASGNAVYIKCKCSVHSFITAPVYSSKRKLAVEKQCTISDESVQKQW